MTVDMRSKHPRTLLCVGQATATLSACYLFYNRIAVVSCNTTCMMQSYNSIELREDTTTIIGCVPNFRTIRKRDFQGEVIT